VAVNSRDEAKVTAAAKSHRCRNRRASNWTGGDVADPDVPERLVGETTRAFDGLDILITTTQVVRLPGPSSHFNEAAWQKAIELVTDEVHVR